MGRGTASAVPKSAKTSAAASKKGGGKRKGAQAKAGGAASKKAKVQAAYECEACKLKPLTSTNASGVMWNTYEDRGSIRIPISPGCKACTRRHERQFAHWSWNAFCTANQEPESENGKLVATAMATESGQQEITFDPSSVEVQHRVGLRSETAVLSVNHVGYEKVFGYKPSYSQKALTINHPKEDGTGEEKRWVFKYKDGAQIPPEAKLMYLTSESLVVMKTTKMDSAEHFYQNQAFNMMGAVLSKRGDVANVKSVVLITMDEEQLRLKKEKGGDEEDSEEELPKTQQPAKGASGEAAHASPMASSPQPGQLPEATSPLPSPFLARPSPPRGWHRALSSDALSLAPGLARSLRSSPPAARSVGGTSFGNSGDDAAADQLSEEPGEDEDDEMDSTTSEAKVRRRIKSLPLAAIMAGRRCGNQERRASELQQKLQKTEVAEIRLLTSHLKLVQHAKAMVPKLLMNLDNASL